MYAILNNQNEFWASGLGGWCSFSVDRKPLYIPECNKRCALPKGGRLWPVNLKGWEQ